MPNRQIVSTKTITAEIVGGFLFFLITFNLCFSIFNNLISSESIFINIIVKIIISIMTIFFSWKFCLHLAFKKRTIKIDKVNVLFRNLIIFIIILCSLITLFNFSKMNEHIEEITYEFNSMDNLAEILLDSGDKAEYIKLKEENINETKIKIYTYFIFIEIFLWTNHIIIFNTHKKTIINYSQKEVNL